MKFSEELALAKKLVEEEGYITEMIINHLVDRKIYHSIATLILSSVFKYNQEQSEEFIYDHEYYKPFLNERNPFNEDYIPPGGLKFKLDDDD